MIDGHRLAGVLLAGLLVFAASLALVGSLRGEPVTRLGAFVVAVVLVGVAVGALRGRSWAVGSAFFIGLFWLWAVSALAVQRQLGTLEAVSWLGWSATVMLTAVRTRERTEGRSDA